MIYLFLFLISTVTYAEERLPNDQVFLTPTFGILTKKDRAYGRRNMGKDYVPDMKNRASTSWQCFDSSIIKISCNAMQDSESEGCYPQIYIYSPQRTDLYLYRQGFGKTYCKDQMFILRRILKAGQVCIAGEYVANGQEKGKDFWQWQFARMKSKKGDYCFWPEDGWGCFSDW